MGVRYPVEGGEVYTTSAVPWLGRSRESHYGLLQEPDCQSNQINEITLTLCENSVIG